MHTGVVEIRITINSGQRSHILENFQARVIYCAFSESCEGSVWVFLKWKKMDIIFFLFLNFCNVFISATQQCKSAIIIHTSLLAQISLRSPNSIPPSHHRGPDWAL